MWRSAFSHTGGDTKDAQLSALYQVGRRAGLDDADKLSFRGDDVFLKVVMLTTDSEFHDEKWPLDAGQYAYVEQADDNCAVPTENRAIGEEYKYEYPDAAMIKEKLDQANIVPIFATTTQVRQKYATLNDELGNTGTNVVLSPDGSNLVDAVIIGLAKVMEKLKNVPFPAACNQAIECPTETERWVPDPCQNGGECTDTYYTKHFCACTEGYTGDNCELEVNHGARGLPRARLHV